ncbi:MAG: helix-turn-helix transcriptional regulator [Vicingaceae bacterium]
MKLYNLTASNFAEEIGVQPSSISHILSGRNKPSLEFLEKVLKRFPKVSADWLILGKTNVQNQQAIVVEEKKSSEASNTQSKTIKKIVVFYNDNTFEEFNKS